MTVTCFNCFRVKPDEGICPYCGYDHTGNEEKFPLALKPGTILANRYYLGRVLGQGGFGITYIALDGNTQSRIALKEYLPRELAMRDQNTQSLQIYSANDLENYEYGKQQFLDEAKTLAQFYGNEHIVSIQSYFEENGTAYFAMEYMEGVNLKQYMEQMGRTLEVYEANRILLPVMESLEWVHSKGIIHRDISPDNIMIRRDGTAKLIDFGSARYSTGEVSRSLDVILKHGFAPVEQYTRRGRQGPYTDVYAMAATYYYAITGKVPPDAVERSMEDEFVPPSALGVEIQKSTEEVLLKGLAVSSSNRWQTMREFYSAMIQSMPRPFEPDGLKNIAGGQRQTPAVHGSKQVKQKTDAGQKTPADAKKIAHTSSEKSSGTIRTASSESSKKKKPLSLIAVLAIVLGIVAALAVGLPRIKNFSFDSSGLASMGSLEDSPESIGQDERNQLLNAAVGDYVTFGSYEQDNNLDNGKEDIEWIVLEKEDSRLLVISRYALDCQPYNTTKAGVTWETCSLRKWLNDTFPTEAFSVEERSMIPSITVSADKNPEYNTESGNSTEDNIFLLSIVEANEYFISNETRRCVPTEYAMVQGAHINENDKVDDRAACRWWLRSPGLYSYYAAFVSSAGSALSGGSDVYSDNFAVRPAMWINLEPGQSQAETSKNPDFDYSVHADSDEHTNTESADESSEPAGLDERNQLLSAEVGDYVTFGSYEQDNNLDNGKEDIEWLVLEKSENRLLVISKYALECQPFNTERICVSWETCTLRKWLNEVFLTSAFTIEDQAIIPSSFVSAEITDNDADQGNDTQDQVFLLSATEANKYFGSDVSRACALTNYALAEVPKGVYIDDYKIDGRTTCMWWLRTTGAKDDCAPIVDKFGGASNMETTVCAVVDTLYPAVRPALWIDLERAKKGDNLCNIMSSSLPDVEVGSQVLFGSYEQDGNLANGKEEIEWLVLAKESNHFLLISKYGLDCQPYHVEFTDITWETCSLRKWLNEFFLNNAFSVEEQAMIPTTTVYADTNPRYDTVQGKDTENKVFLLSIQEANKYFSTDEARRCAPTDYAVEQGADTGNSYKIDGKETCLWWLRSAGHSPTSAAVVRDIGFIDTSGHLVNYTKETIRPALWVNLES